MIDPHPQADGILVAQLTAEARHRARWRELTGDEDAAGRGRYRRGPERAARRCHRARRRVLAGRFLGLALGPRDPRIGRRQPVRARSFGIPGPLTFAPAAAWRLTPGRLTPGRFAPGMFAAARSASGRFERVRTGASGHQESRGPG